MDDYVFWPQWLEPHRVHDEALAEAYDAAPAPYRACIKNCMAFLHALWGESPDETCRETTDTARGYRYCVRNLPAPWTLTFCTPAYAASPRFTAAVMPALLARVPQVGAICVGQEASLPSPVVRVALELMGVEDIFCLPPPKAHRLLREVREANGTGRLLLLHDGELNTLREAAASLEIPSWEERRPPQLRLHAPADHDLELLRFCHPDAPLREISREDAARGHGVDALFTDALTPFPVPLLLRTGMEGCWAHKGLDTAFFRRRSILGEPCAPTGGYA